MRTDIAEPMLDLLEADYFASFIWDKNHKSYGEGVYLNMDDTNISQYYDYYQFHDPITHRLSLKRDATAVSEIMPHQQLKKTQFFNDFLLNDGLYHGVNLHLYNFEENIGDMRIWRKKGRGDFDKSACTILDLLKPHLIQAIKQIRVNTVNSSNHQFNVDEISSLLKRQYSLTERELQVARLLVIGERDEYIASQLHIALTTVRTHIKNIFKKTGINNRNKLQAALKEL
ncbi:helix-turn-helix transcriptional regulator [Neptuniibacter sp. QD34_54]|uniref:helix-turn-helix transcriptional regulator n=1 Tax=Neptuniibacter sp. QD34_54 TaxID=3398208 RepID=UPI0039F4A4D9